MRKHGKRELRPRVDQFEDRCLLSSLAVVDLQNQSSYKITYDLRWTPGSAWTAYTEAPGQSQIISTAYSASLTPQVEYNKTTSLGSQTIVNLAQGYGQWTGTGTPPASSGTVYAFENNKTGVQLYYVAPPSLTTDAVVEITNSSSYDITFDFRWTPSSPWTAYTEAPGQAATIDTAYSSTLSPRFSTTRQRLPDRRRLSASRKVTASGRDPAHLPHRPECHTDSTIRRRESNSRTSVARRPRHQHPLQHRRPLRHQRPLRRPRPRPLHADRRQLQRHHLTRVL